MFASLCTQSLKSPGLAAPITAMYVPDDHYVLDYKGRCCLLIAGKMTNDGDFDQLLGWQLRHGGQSRNLYGR